MAHTPRIQCDDAYLTMVGRAVFNFTYLEWNVIWLIENLRPGYLSTKWMKKPAGAIADDFDAAIRQSSALHSIVRNDLNGVSTAFRGAIQTRNDILHAHPFSAGGGEQQLIRHKPDPAASNIQWGQSDLKQAASSIEDAALKANSCFHTHFATA